MFDRVLIILLLFGLLTCPVRCAVGSFESGEAASQAAPVCSCCQHDTADDIQDRAAGNSRPAEDDCGCSDCLCEGAISELSGQRVWADSADDAFLAGPVMRNTGICGVAEHAPVSLGLGEKPSGWCCAGRQTRIAHQSFLI